MIKKNTSDIDIMSMVLEYRFKNKIITNLHSILLELAISHKGIYEQLLTKNVDEIILLLTKMKGNFEYENIKENILEYLEEGYK